jgi:hypothetical protein
MASEPANRPPAIADRSRLLLVLVTPFALLLAATALSWPWRALDLPGTVGSLTPPAILALALAVLGAGWALQRNLPIGMLTWVPAGQGAIVLLTTGFIAETSSSVIGVAVIFAYVIIYFIVLAIAIAISGTSTSLGLSFVAFFVLTQAARFPLFGDAAETTVANAGLLTFVAFLIAAVELGLLAWLARRLIEAPESETGGVAVLIIGLTVLHGLFASWEDPTLRGEFGGVQVIEQFVRWIFLVSLQMALAFGLIRMRRMGSSEPRWAEPEPDPPANETATGTQVAFVDGEPDDAAPLHRPGRPSPRRRGRRR